MFKVMWWNANGKACISESMSKDAATAFQSSMLPEQEARLVYINTR